jgi:hypothetical protein
VQPTFVVASTGIPTGFAALIALRISKVNPGLLSKMQRMLKTKLLLNFFMVSGIGLVRKAVASAIKKASVKITYFSSFDRVLTLS